MRFSYAKSFHAAELVVTAVVSSPARFPLCDVDAKIDTGSDLCSIPSALADILGLQPIAYSTMRGALAEEWRSVPIYRVQMRVAGESWIATKAVRSPNSYMLLGRNLLNQFILTANGPAGYFDLELPPPP